VAGGAREPDDGIGLPGDRVDEVAIDGKANRISVRVQLPIDVAGDEAESVEIRRVGEHAAAERRQAGLFERLEPFARIRRVPCGVWWKRVRWAAVQF
jgi:hypothetical protein